MPDRRLGLSLVLFAVLLAVLGVYYWVHKPVTPGQAAALGGALADLGAAAWIALAGAGLGRRLLRPLPLASPGERLALQAAAGWGGGALILLGLGLLGMYTLPAAWLLMLGGTALLWRDMRGWLSDILPAARSLWPRDRLSVFAAACLVLALSAGLLEALAPPLKWDALVYHLTLPKLYAQAHSIRLDQDFIFLGMPQVTEMLYTLAYLLRGGTAAQVLGWIFGLALTLGLAGHASEALGERSGARASAFLFASLTVALSLAWAYVDLLLMVYALATLTALRQWRLTRRPAWIWLAGGMAGLALGCKYTGLVVPAGAAAVIWLAPLAGAGPRRRLAALREALPPLLVFSLAALATFAPWLLKNWLLLGNPVYPLIFSGFRMDSLRQWFYNRPDLVDANPLWAALIFFRAVFLGVQGGKGYDASLSPLLVILPLGLALGWRRLAADRRDELRPLALFALGGYALWVAMMFVSAFAIQPRLFFGLFPALAVLCAGGLAAVETLDSPRLRVSWIVSAAVAFSLGLSLLQFLVDFAGRSPLALLAGRQTALEYRYAQLGAYAAAIDAVNGLPDGSRVQFLWEARSLECQRMKRCLPDTVIDHWWYLRRTKGTAEAAVSQWKSAGVTHLLVYETGVKFVQSDPQSPFDDADWAELDALRARLRLLQDIGGAYSLYALP